ncbi:hypothetical protein KIN20_024877 [Parelaphostrongylus tenuis]|uniref:Uncharacterized protein n=1 Tax=Parelaphostrongylus tenuis TaxID=148309 RepID=A0AAD5NAB7_PARTN|nr:hypothetical protein KIN20_024877 [Parelaphostrongylus tenuis]
MSSRKRAFPRVNDNTPTKGQDLKTLSGFGQSSTSSTLHSLAAKCKFQFASSTDKTPSLKTGDLHEISNYR